MKLYRTSGELIGEGESLAEFVASNKANLRGADLRGANLRGANLRGADLREADLSWADLREADLSWANLRGADLRWANLRGANLRGADLRGANLRGADLREADLREADLRGADLRGADLRGANLSWANLRGAGCVQMECGPWFIWITPERCSIGCQDHPHEFWQSATPKSVAPMHEHASEFWLLWGEMILAACRACAKHGWPKAKE